jgi:glycosyltransferase involved in cell wall biosynthesis
MSERYPLTFLALENCLGCIVHTPDAFNQLSKDNRYAVVYAPLPAVFGPKPESEPATLRSIEPPYHLILFGHLGRNRRLDAVLEALSRLAQRDCFRLDIYGNSNNPKKLRQKIRALNLTEIVTLHSYAEEDTLDHALKKAHIAINLRYPTMGEASASQLRIWSCSLPSLVTKVGWYASLPEDAVAHVRPDHEVDDIQTHLADFLNDPQKFVRMGASGLAALKDHDPQAYVRNVCDVVEKSRQLRLTAVARELAQRAGSLLSPLTADPGNDSVRIAQQIYALTS